MDAHLSLASSKQNRELSTLCGEILELSSLQSAREHVLASVAKWLSLDQAIWVLEPRSLEPPMPGSTDFLNLLAPVDPMLFEPMMAFRHLNPLLKAMIDWRDARPIQPTEFMSRQAWARNPFHQEVCANMGLREMMAVEICDGEVSRDAIRAVVIGRNHGGFSELECQRFDRIRWMVQPLLAHLRMNEARAKHATISISLDMLTPREMEVFHWMGQGKRNKEIGSIIRCAPRTVEKHVESILRKTNTETRGSAVALRSHK